MAKKNQQEKILNYTLETVNIEEICPNSIDGVILSIEENHLNIDIPSSMTSEIYKKWLNGKGGVFSSDIKKFLRGKNSGTYILMEGEGERSIIRLIEDDEIDLFENNKLINGKVKDKPYMILRNLSDGVLTSVSRYIEETEEVEELQSDIPQNNENNLIQPMKLFED